MPTIDTNAPNVQSSPLILVVEGDLPTGVSVPLPQGTYAAGDSAPFVIAADGVHQFLAGDVPLDKFGNSTGKKLEFYAGPAFVDANGDYIPMKLNSALAGVGIYQTFALRVHPTTGKVRGYFLLNNTPNGHMQWQTCHIDGLPPLTPFDFAQTGGGGSGGGLTKADVIQIVKDWFKGLLG